MSSIYGTGRAAPSQSQYMADEEERRRRALGVVGIPVQSVPQQQGSSNSAQRGQSAANAASQYNPPNTSIQTRATGSSQGSHAPAVGVGAKTGQTAKQPVMIQTQTQQDAMNRLRAAASAAQQPVNTQAAAPLPPPQPVSTQAAAPLPPPPSSTPTATPVAGPPDHSRDVDPNPGGAGWAPDRAPEWDHGTSIMPTGPTREDPREDPMIGGPPSSGLYGQPLPGAPATTPLPTPEEMPTDASPGALTMGDSGGGASAADGRRWADMAGAAARRYGAQRISADQYGALGSAGTMGAAESPSNSWMDWAGYDQQYSPEYRPGDEYGMFNERYQDPGSPFGAYGGGSEWRRAYSGLQNQNWNPRGDASWQGDYQQAMGQGFDTGAANAQTRSDYERALGLGAGAPADTSWRADYQGAISQGYTPQSGSSWRNDINAAAAQNFAGAADSSWQQRANQALAMGGPAEASGAWRGRMDEALTAQDQGLQAALDSAMADEARAGRMAAEQNAAMGRGAGGGLAGLQAQVALGGQEMRRRALQDYAAQRAGLLQSYGGMEQSAGEAQAGRGTAWEEGRRQGMLGVAGQEQQGAEAARAREYGWEQGRRGLSSEAAANQLSADEAAKARELEYGMQGRELGAEMGAGARASADAAAARAQDWAGGQRDILSEMAGTEQDRTERERDRALEWAMRGRDIGVEMGGQKLAASQEEARRGQEWDEQSRALGAAAADRMAQESEADKGRRMQEWTTKLADKRQQMEALRDSAERANDRGMQQYATQMSAQMDQLDRLHDAAERSSDRNLQRETENLQARMFDLDQQYQLAKQRNDHEQEAKVQASMEENQLAMAELEAMFGVQDVDVLREMMRTGWKPQAYGADQQVPQLTPQELEDLKIRNAYNSAFTTGLVGAHIGG